MKNPFINMKTVIKGRFKAIVGDGAGSGASQNFLKAGVGARDETNSFGSTTLGDTHAKMKYVMRSGYCTKHRQRRPTIHIE
jgi:hypothetical protein